MTVGKSTKKRPVKPYPEFPLFAHNNGQWCRKIRGKLYSFGRWEDPTSALKKHNNEYSLFTNGIENRLRLVTCWLVGSLFSVRLLIVSFFFSIRV